jgi:hypothetical protein
VRVALVAIAAASRIAACGGAARPVPFDFVL